MRAFVVLIFLVLSINWQALAQDKTTGTSFAGIPSVSYSSDLGLEYGARLYVYHYGNGTVSPYKWNLSTNISQTTKQRRDMFLFIDIPQIIGPDSRLDLYIDSKRFIKDDYYGIGNDNTFHDGYEEQDSPDYIDENYYTVKRKWFAVLTKLQFPLYIEGLKGLAGFGFYNTDVDAHSGQTLFSEDMPFGRDGGLTNYVQLGVVFDRRDSESITTKGVWTEALVEKTVKALGSDYHYWRLTFTDRRYFSLHPRLVYAQRLMYEAMPGSPPYYEMSFISSSYQRREGLGGGYSMRGIPRFFLLGPNKFLSNFELRLRTLHKRILKQDFTGYVHLFLDAGRVWTDEDKKELTDLHFSRGFGLHVKWNKDFVGSLDFGFSKFNSFAVYATFGNLF